MTTKGTSESNHTAAVDKAIGSKCPSFVTTYCAWFVHESPILFTTDAATNPYQVGYPMSLLGQHAWTP